MQTWSKTKRKYIAYLDKKLEVCAVLNISQCTPTLMRPVRSIALPH